MTKWITKQEILNLIKNQTFKSEDNFRDYLIPKITKIFKVKEDQIEGESITTSFDHTLSNRADIVIRTNDQFKKAIIVIELKLSKSVNIYKNGDYEEPLKQLYKYCQDTRAPYGILMTDETCFIYENKYFSYNQTPKRVEKNRIPSISKIEDKMAFYALLDFLLYKKSLKFILPLIVMTLLLGLISNASVHLFGLWVTLFSEIIVGLIAGVVMAFLINFFKIIE